MKSIGDELLLRGALGDLEGENEEERDRVAKNRV